MRFQPRPVSITRDTAREREDKYPDITRTPEDDAEEREAVCRNLRQSGDYDEPYSPI